MVRQVCRGISHTAHAHVSPPAEHDELTHLASSSADSKALDLFTAESDRAVGFGVEN